MNKEIIIEIEKIHKSFKGKTVLDGISLEVFKGEILSVIGRSGIGKSVLIKHITRLLTPDKGRIIYHGRDIANFKKKELFLLRKNVSMLFQSGALFDSMNVEENLALPLVKHTKLSKKEIDFKVAEKLDMVGMSNVQKLTTSELSGGMKKRVGLARSIILEPAVMLYDEPTTGLDPIMSDVINKLILRLNRELNMTSIVITHDMNSVRAVSDRIAMIHNGKIIFKGNIKEIDESKNHEVICFINGISNPI